MDCKTFRETADLYIDHELAPEALAATHLHMQDCNSCRSVTTALLTLRRQMKAVVAQHQPPAKLVEAIQRIPQSLWRRSPQDFDVRHLRRKVPSVWRRNLTVAVSLVVLVVAGLVIYEGSTLANVIWLRSHNPTSSALMESRASESRREQSWVPIEKISTDLQRAVIAGEDPNFTRHHGFDYQAIQRAWEQEGGFEFKRGGSTISQQLAKNLFLSSERSMARKTREAIITLFLEGSLTKRRILELYLNVIYWGNGVFGAEAAAQYYFHKSAAALSQEEAAFLAAIIPSPEEELNPEKHPERVTRRQAVIMRSITAVEIP